jgi:hypothetical protein
MLKCNAKTSNVDIHHSSIHEKANFNDLYMIQNLKKKYLLFIFVK